MIVRYPGPHEAVEIAATSQVVRKGETVEVPKDIGESLVRQGWAKVPAKRTTTRKPRAARATTEPLPEARPQEV